MKSFQFSHTPPPPTRPPAKMHDGKHFFGAKNLGVSTNNSLPVAI